MDEEKTLLSLKREKRRSFFSLWGKDCCPHIPARYVLAIMSCLGIVNVSAARVNLSVAIVEMDNGTSTVQGPGMAKEFNWTSAEQGWVLTAFFYGYALAHFPGGWLAQRVGGKWVFGIAIVMTSVFTLFTPIAAYTSVWLLVTLRVIEGFFEGMTFPAIQSMWEKWAPSPERSRLSTITFAGSEVGNVISFPLSAVLCQYGFDGGWPSVYYVFGILGIVWFIFWTLLAFDSPATHPRISQEERLYIESTLSSEEHSNSSSQSAIPWLAIVTSPAVWAIAVAHFCGSWGSYTLLTTMPTYYRQTLPNIHLGNSNSTSIVLNGVFSAIPYILLAVMIPICGQIADFMRAHGFSTTIVRKSFSTGASVFGALFLLLAGYLSTTTATAVTFLTLAVGAHAMGVTGIAINPLDIAPRYAAVLYGIAGSIGTIPGIVGPQIAKAIAIPPNAPVGSPDYINKFRDEWREVFIISAEIYIFGGLIYLILGSGKIQPWADGPVNTAETIEKQRKKYTREKQCSQVPSKTSKTEETVLPKGAVCGTVTVHVQETYVQEQYLYDQM